MEVLIVSGFLGAGKTTFIKELARKSGRDFVVYENEYGQADIDAKELSQVDELTVWESTENCICCSGRQDFASSVLTISNTFDPDYLVVEPTGVAKLSSVVENVNLVCYEHISLLEPLTIIDGGAWRSSRDKFPEIFIDQVVSANTLVVSKTDRLISEELSHLNEWLNKQNPGATIIADSWDNIDPEWFLSLLHIGANHKSDSCTMVPGINELAANESSKRESTIKEASCESDNHAGNSFISDRGKKSLCNGASHKSDSCTMVPGINELVTNESSTRESTIKEENCESDYHAGNSFISDRGKKSLHNGASHNHFQHYHNHSQHNQHHHNHNDDSGFTSIAIKNASLPTENHLLWFLDALVAGTFGEIVRAKGFLPCGGQLLRFDVVDRAWQVSGAETYKDEEPTCVFIGTNFKACWLNEVFLQSAHWCQP